jgi:hypothetical protein
LDDPEELASDFFEAFTEKTHPRNSRGVMKRYPAELASEVSESNLKGFKQYQTKPTFQQWRRTMSLRFLDDPSRYKIPRVLYLVLMDKI